MDVLFSRLHRLLWLRGLRAFVSGSWHRISSKAARITDPGYIMSSYCFQWSDLWVGNRVSENSTIWRKPANNEPSELTSGIPCQRESFEDQAESSRWKGSRFSRSQVLWIFGDWDFGWSSDQKTQCMFVLVILLYSCWRTCQVLGRILIDFYGYAKHHKGLERIEKSPGNQKANGPEGESTYLKPLDDKAQQANKASMLTKYLDLAFVSQVLSGFALREKPWRKTNYPFIQEVNS